MNYQKKILKYKARYLMLKNKINQVGGAKIPFGAIVKVNVQNGVMDGLSQQCMWISILQYLQQYHPDKHNYQILTIDQLRGIAGLSDDTKHNEFDDTIPMFIQALRRTVDVFGLHINFYSGERYSVDDGLSIVYDNINEIPHPSENMRINRYPNEVNIISYGRHFELILPNKQVSDYKIFLPLEKNLYDMTTAPKDIKKKYQEYDELRSRLLHIEKEINQVRINKLNQMPKDWDEERRAKAQEQYMKERDDLLKEIYEPLSRLKEELKMMILSSKSIKPVSGTTVAYSPSSSIYNIASKVASTGLGAVSKVASTGLGVVSKVASTGLGAVSKVASTGLGAVSSVIGSFNTSKAKDKFTTDAQLRQEQLRQPSMQNPSIHKIIKGTGKTATELAEGWAKLYAKK